MCEHDLDPTIFAKRFFVLRGGELSYFKEPKSRMLAKINLNEVSSLQPLKVLGAPDGTEYHIEGKKKRVLEFAEGKGKETTWTVDKASKGTVLKIAVGNERRG